MHVGLDCVVAYCWVIPYFVAECVIDAVTSLRLRRLRSVGFRRCRRRRRRCLSSTRILFNISLGECTINTQVNFGLRKLCVAVFYYWYFSVLHVRSRSRSEDTETNKGEVQNYDNSQAKFNNLHDYCDMT